MKSAAEGPMVVEVEPPRYFVETPFIRALVERAQTYLAAGFPVHLRGVSGTGKTTLALHLARRLGRPMVMVHGDEETTSSGLVGSAHGYRLRRVQDNYIRTVRRYEEDVLDKWVDDRLTIACRDGYTLLYDEFNRSRPEANNTLLSILQEGILSLPAGRSKETPYLHVHPGFRAIFTSNPEEYAGVHPTQDALRERMITLDLGNFDQATEVAVTHAHSQSLRKTVCETIVAVVRGVRDLDIPAGPTVRSCIKIARSLEEMGVVRLTAEPRVEAVFRDILVSGSSRSGEPRELAALEQKIGQVLARGLGKGGRAA